MSEQTACRLCGGTEWRVILPHATSAWASGSSAVVLTCRNGCQVTDDDMRKSLGLEDWRKSTPDPGHPCAIADGCRCCGRRNPSGLGCFAGHAANAKTLAFEVADDCPLHRIGTEWRFWKSAKILKPPKAA